MRWRSKWIQPLRRVDVWEVFGQAVDDVMRALFQLWAVRNVVEVGVGRRGAAEEDDAEDHEGCEGGDDLEAAREIGAGIPSRHSQGAMWRLALTSSGVLLPRNHAIVLEAIAAWFEVCLGLLLRFLVRWSKGRLRSSF